MCCTPGREQIAILFVGDASDSEKERSLVVDTLPLVSLALLGDGIQGTLSGVVRGVGYQATGTILNAVAYLVVRVPMTAI